MCENKGKIIDIDDIDIITNGSLEDLKQIKNPNQIGKVIDENNEVVSNITPLFMIINQGCKDYKKKISNLVEIGADLDMKIDYYGREISARELAVNYRNYED